MFWWSKVKILQDEIAHLREENRKLIDRLTALMNPQAFGAVYSAEHQTPVVQDEE